MRRRLALAATGLAAAIAVAGCGSGTSNTGHGLTGATPSSRLQNAFTNLTAGSTLTATLHFGQSGQALAKLGSAAGSMSPAQARKLAALQLRATVHTTAGTLRTLQSGATPQVDFTVLEGSTPMIDIREVGGNLFLQAQVQQLLGTFGAPAGVYGSLRARATQLPSFVRALVAGKWVELSKDAINQLKSIFEQQLASASASPPPSAGARLEADLLAIYKKDITVTEAGAAADGTYTLTGNIHTIGTDFLNAEINVLPQAVQSQLRPRLQSLQIPDKIATLHATVADSKVSRLSLDVGQFAPPSDAGVHGDVDLDFSTADRTVTAPTGAVPVDISQLGALFGQLQGSASSGVTGSGGGSGIAPSS